MSRHDRAVWERTGTGKWASRSPDAEDKRVRLAREIGFPTEYPTVPELYENARRALAECSRVDELAAWSNKASALQTYAQQIHDNELLKMAMRIKLRALREAGVILNDIDARGWYQKYHGDDQQRPVTRREVAKAAGLSKNNQDNACRLARIPEKKFEALVEDTNPPGVYRAALAGREWKRSRKTAEGTPEGATPLWPKHDDIRELRDAVQSYLDRAVAAHGGRRLRTALHKLGPLDTSEKKGGRE